MAPRLLTERAKEDISLFLKSLEVPVSNCLYSFMRVEFVCDYKCMFSKANVAESCVLSRDFKRCGRTVERAVDLLTEGVKSLKNATDSGQYDPEIDPSLEPLVNYLECMSPTIPGPMAKLVPRPGVEHDSKSKKEMVTLVASHLLQKLIPTNGKTLEIDDHSVQSGEAHHGVPSTSKTVQHCLCNCGCGAKIQLGNTALGNTQVFHGRVDAFIDTVAVIVSPDDDDERDEHCIMCDLEDEEEGEPVKKHSKTSSNEISKTSAFEVESENFTDTSTLKLENALSQTLAVCIVNACYHFFQRGCDEALLIPTILVTKDAFSVYLYNPTHDILLRSQQLRYLDVTGSIIHLWCILNTKIMLPEGIVGKQLSKYRSGFPEKSSNFGLYKTKLYRGVDFKADSVEDMKFAEADRLLRIDSLDNWVLRSEAGPFPALNNG